jgi:hypothetical protein
MSLRTVVSLKYLVCALCLTLSAASEAQTKTEPSPTPTPSPGTLAAYASRISLDPRMADPSTGSVVITTEDLAELAAEGTVTFGEYTAGQQLPAKPADGSGGAQRGMWRARFLNQRKAVSKIEARRSEVLADIEAINRERVTPRTLARLDRAKVKLRLVDKELRRARLELARIVREARRRGAEPGWFR